MVYMFNELSLTKARSIKEASEILEQFVRACIAAKDIGFTELRLHEGHIQTLYEINLFNNYNIDNWLKDPAIDEVLQIRFREIITSIPLITEEEIQHNYLYKFSEFHAILSNSKTEVWGLGAAYLYNTLSVSLSTHNAWKNSLVVVEHYYISEDDEVFTEQISAKHFSDVNTLNQHIPWWEETQKESLKCSAELWERRTEFFPYLVFSPEVEKQLKSIGISKVLSQIIERMRELNNYAKNWTFGDFDYNHANNNTNLRISPESKSTIQKFGTQRKFSVEGKGKLLFDLHIKTGDLRFHFYPDNENKQIYVGYIGKHLRIASEN